MYVEPNAGSAGGGHLALRLDDRVYHFQNAGDRWLRMDRVDADWFRYAYSVLQNRDIHLARFEIEDREREALRDRLNRRYLLEQRQFALLKALGSDRALLERIASGARGRGRAEREASRGFRGAGFFRDSRDEAPSLTRLRARLLAERGSDYLTQRMGALRAALRSLPLRLVDAAALEAAGHAGGPGVVTLSERFEDLALQHAALATLSRAAALRPDELRPLNGRGGILTERERRRLRSFAERLEARLARLPESPRPDWGYPMLLGMARLAAIESSLARNRLMVLDGYPHDARSLPGHSDARRAFLAEWEEEAARQLAIARHSVNATPELDERGYNGLEDAANRLIEVHLSRTGARALRVHGSLLIPEGWGRIAELPLPRGRGADLKALQREARSAEEHYARLLGDRYEYHVVHHNCATELLRILAPNAARDGATRFDFIPALAFRDAKRRGRGVAEARIPSYRSTRLAQMRLRENRFAVALRESNTLTSSVYRRNPFDSWFLFFTDESVWPRPLLGAFNVATGVAETTWGLIALPFAGGERLRSGASGLAFSLPELVFLNFRKGTLEYARGDAPRTESQPVRAP